MTKHKAKRGASPKLPPDPPGTFRQVMDNPYRGTQDEHPTVNALKRCASDHMGAMHSLRHIDATQLQAARIVERWISIASTAGCRGVDPTREFVDTTGVGDVITDQLLDAHRGMDRCRQVLGTTGWLFARAIISGEKNISQAAGILRLQADRKQQRVYAGKRFRECLDDLASHFGLA